jgi:hypothetical protein
MRNLGGDTRVLTLTNLDCAMRMGYVLRCIDEALREYPRTKAEVETGRRGSVGRVSKKKLGRP